MNLSNRPRLFSRTQSGLKKHFEKREARNKPENRPKRSRHFIPSTSKRFGMDNQGDTIVSKWQTYSTPARLFIARNQRKLVARSRDIIMNNDYGRAFLRMVVQNVVGENGIRFQASARTKDGTLDTEVNEAVEKAWLDWSTEMYCDLAEEETFVDIQQSLVTSLCTDGEFFTRIHHDESSKYKMRLQVLDPQRCSPVETRKFQNDKKENLCNGILLDRATGKPVAYLFGNEHTNDNYYDDSTHRYNRIPASEIIHGFLRERVGQKRGLPIIHTALNRTHNLDQYEGAALLSARVGAAKAGFLEWNDEIPPDVDGLDGMEMSSDPFSFTELAPGLKISTWDPTYPNEQYDTFVRSMLRAISTGMGVSYHDLANDLTDVNYSSIRQGALDVRENWKVMQQWFIRRFCRPTYRIWLPQQLRNGSIKTSKGKTLTLMDLEKCLEVTWTGRRWDWIDPKSEAIANVEQIRHFLVSPSQVIRDLGRDPQEVWRQIAQDIESMKKAGIPEELILDALSNQIQQFEVDSEDEATSQKPKNTKPRK